MTKGKKNSAVVFGLTANHIFAVASVMMDLKRVSPNLADEIVIIHDGVSERDQRILKSLLPTRFIKYEFPLKDRRVINAKAVQQFTKMVFTKFECLRLLNEYRSVMWLDYDIVVQGDLSELFEPCESGIKMMPSGISVRGQLLREVPEYDMTAEGMGAGLFIFHDALRNYMQLYQFCYEKLREYADVLYLPEQAIFDFMIQEFGLKVVPIDRRIYSPHPTDLENAACAKIIHAYGQPKFWNGLLNDHWERNYQDWLKMGGSKYIETKSIYRKAIMAMHLMMKKFIGTS